MNHNLDLFVYSKIINHTPPRLPLKAGIDVTYRCNNDCLHCWLVEPDAGKARDSELTTGDWLSIIDQSRALGIREWTVSGGEPLIRDDFAEILSYIKQKSKFVTVFSNGTLIPSYPADLFKGCDLQISLYGATPLIHDHVTRSTGSFEKAMQGIRYLQENHIPFTIRIFPLKDNFFEWPHMLELAKTLTDTVRIGASWLHLSASGNELKNEEIRSQRLDPAQVISLDPPNLCYDERFNDAEKCSKMLNDDRLFAGCIAGRKEFHIDPYGKMSFCLCVQDPRLRYDLVNGSVSEAWDAFIPSCAGIIRGDKQYIKTCGNCDQRLDCKWCSVYSYLEHREHGRPVDYLCHISVENKRYKENWQKHHRRFFEIAGISIQVDSDRPFDDGEFDKRFDSFIRPSPGTDLVRLEHHYGLPKIANHELGKKVFHHAPWKVYQKENGWIYISYLDTPPDEQWLQVTVFNKDYSHAHIYNNPDIFGQGKSFNSLAHYTSDQLWIAHILSLRQGFYLHSTGLITNGDGLLFVGHSEAGKSTTTRMFTSKALVLCDDRNIVRRWNDGWHVHGSWSHGEIPDVSNHSAPLRAVFFIEKAPANRLIMMHDHLQRKQRLLSCLIRPVITPDWWELVLPLVNDLARSVPCYIMEFDKSGDIVPIIEKLIIELPSAVERDSQVNSIPIEQGVKHGVTC
jgi:MoaA/NifB/PqqE/SkfB family radical SAM enzyme